MELNRSDILSENDLSRLLFSSYKSKLLLEDLLLLDNDKSGFLGFKFSFNIF